MLPCGMSVDQRAIRTHSWPHRQLNSVLLVLLAVVSLAAGFIGNLASAVPKVCPTFDGVSPVSDSRHSGKN